MHIRYSGYDMTLTNMAVSIALSNACLVATAGTDFSHTSCTTGSTKEPHFVFQGLKQQQITPSRLLKKSEIL